MEKKTILQKLNNAKKEFPVIKRDGVNPYHNTTYATLESINNATSPILAKYNLLITHQVTNDKDSGSFLVTRLHDLENGEFLESKITIEEGLSSQKIGAAITYYRRYNTTALLDLTTEEDLDEIKQKETTKPKPKSKTNLL